MLSGEANVIYQLVPNSNFRKVAVDDVGAAGGATAVVVPLNATRYP